MCAVVRRSLTYPSSCTLPAPFLRRQGSSRSWPQLFSAARKRALTLLTKLIRSTGQNLQDVNPVVNASLRQKLVWTRSRSRLAGE